MSALGDSVRETSSSLHTVFRNPGLRRINLALAGSLIGDWAYATAVTVWAYGVGGTTAVGVWGVVRLIIMALVAPFASTLADKYSRKLVMVTADLARFVLVISAAAVIYWHGPDAVVFVTATIASACGSVFRPAQMALLPSLVNEPDELTAANGTSSTLESLAFFVGPALGGLLLTVADVPTVFLLNALTFLWSASLVIGIKVPARTPVVNDTTNDEPGSEPDSKPGFLHESMAGFGEIWRNTDLRLVTGLYCAQTIVAGASLVFGIAIAVDIVKHGPQGVGYLDAVLGVGAILGGLLAISRSHKHRLATDFGIGVLFWAIPLLLISVWPVAVAAFAAMFIIGGANPIVDVNASTILQRLTPDEVLGRVFGALESALISTMALGALLMPLLISWVGLRWGLVILAGLIVVLVVPGFARLRKLDSSLRPADGLDLLRGVALFAPLDGPLLENLARRTVLVNFIAGDVIMREGDRGDRFYVIDTGEVSVTHEGRELRRETKGEFFGEIALVRDVPRTATVTAVTDVTLRALERDDFLAALDGNSEVRSATDDIVSRRLPTV